MKLMNTSEVQEFVGFASSSGRIDLRSEIEKAQEYAAQKKREKAERQEQQSLYKPVLDNHKVYQNNDFQT
jgi:ribosomal protein S11